MSRLIAIAVIAVLNLLAAAPAQAATAYLVSCTGATSPSGRFIYVGIYDYAGAQVTATFTNWCPASIEVQ